MGRKNQSRLQRARVVSTILAFVSILGFAYTNCGGGITPTAYDSDRGIFSTDPTSVFLKVDHPVFVQKKDDGFNVGGECGTDLFPEHEMVWKLTRGGTVVRIGRVRNVCINRQFSLRVLVPSSYIWDERHVIEINLNALDEDGEMQATQEIHVDVKPLSN